MKNKKMKISAGLLIIKDNKILLGHPTRQKWFNTFTIPKGKLEEGETILDAAIRETHEEVGILIDKSLINENEQYIVEYKKENGNCYKKIYYYIVNVNDYDDIIDEKQLQLSEIDYAAFYTKEDAENKIFWRIKELLNHLK